MVDERAWARAGRLGGRAVVVVVIALAAGCGAAGVDVTGTSSPDGASCSRAPITGTVDAASYPSSLDELAAAADAVVEARIIGDAGPVTDRAQPMAVAVERTYIGEVAEEITVERLQTEFGVTGTEDRYVGAWDGEPWYCPGERYLLFLDATDDGTYLALTKVGAIRLEPSLTFESETIALVPELAGLDVAGLRAGVEAAVARRSTG